MKRDTRCERERKGMPIENSRVCVILTRERERERERGKQRYKNLEKRVREKLRYPVVTARERETRKRVSDERESQ